jgi:alpha-L-fucosidase
MVGAAALAATALATLARPATAADMPTTQPGPAPAPAPESAQQRDARMTWWRDARFGMFIHWGIYSVPAGVFDGKEIPDIGEWIMNHGKIPVARYAQFARQFDPQQFNAEQWVNIAKSAGMRYIVITAKHHDGFAMFHTHVDGYNIYDATPFHRDPLAELAAACKTAGIKLGFYYSQTQDWHHPGGAAIGGHWDPAQDGDFASYVRAVAQPQIKELLTNYGPVAVLWFDTPTDQMTHDLAEPFVTLLHQYQPQIIWNNRLGGGFQGDTETPEQHVPPNGYPGRDWETCMTINDTWGYKVHDDHFKSNQTLIRNLIDIASKGGNYLLNVGPTARGVIPPPEVERLEAIGKWLDVNGEAIYGTSASPFTRALDFGRVTQKPGRLYLSVFDKPVDGTLWLPMKGKITRAYLVEEPEQQLEIGTASGGVTINLPQGVKLDPGATVVVAEVDGPVDAFAPTTRVP